MPVTVPSNCNFSKTGTLFQDRYFFYPVGGNLTPLNFRTRGKIKNFTFSAHVVGFSTIVLFAIRVLIL